MKKSAMMLVAVCMLCIASLAWAAPKALPAGTMVSAVCNGDNTATVSISGVQPESMEYYFYFKDLEKLGGASQYQFNLDEGRRFNFTFGGGFYAGLSREMAKKQGFPAAFLGANIDIDSSDPRGSAFVITCPVRK